MMKTRDYEIELLKAQITILKLKDDLRAAHRGLVRLSRIVQRGRNAKIFAGNKVEDRSTVYRVPRNYGKFTGLDPSETAPLNGKSAVRKEILDNPWKAVKEKSEGKTLQPNDAWKADPQK